MTVPMLRSGLTLMSLGEGNIDQEYKVNDDSFVHIFDSNWYAQSFTPAANHTLGRVILKLDREGAPGLVTCSVRATSAGKPTGSDLAVATFNLDTPSLILTGGQWFYFTMTTPYAVTSSTVYALVVRSAGVDTNNDALWQADITSPTYAGGSIITSSDSGGTWNAPDTTVDTMFKEGAL